LKGLLRGSAAASFGCDLVDLWREAKDLCGGLEELFECIALLNRVYIPPGGTPTRGSAARCPMRASRSVVLMSLLAAPNVS